MAALHCPACATENRPGRRFCAKCGSALALQCPRCGAVNEPDDSFCGSCGSALAADAVSSRQVPAGTPSAVSVSERRLVSVLFADLVGFTTLSEHRDPEEVRELLSSYFDRCRLLIERYGGTVEKFIGDAVMAVWGTPVAREDDPERAVRAALTLTQMVTTLGSEVGLPDLRARAGVLTGNAAVQIGAQGEAMVLGDTVNTASRLQSIAAPGSVLVDDVTRRASEAAIAYDDTGVHEVKGREQPVRAWTALRVVAGTGGARRSAGLEAPFVGRESELQAIIDASDESAHRRLAGHIALVGDAGSGKSRLLWEFFKYLDGIKEARWWHQGRCLSYGEGVAYWALAEMIRQRARIQEEEDPASAREKLHTVVEQFVSDERERRLVEPRLAHLLRLEERPDADRADLFSGWRLFFERMASEDPVILVFEDLQWADSGLLDFVDYLLEWSADFPIFVVTLARPELRERRPSWDLLFLHPLEAATIELMLDGLAPGLPEQLVEDIARRSEGIPLYAVETIRMLQDRGVLVQDGPHYVVTGDVSDLEVPETLHALVASRLDGLSASERSLLQDASVLGQSFTAAAAAALSGRAANDAAEVLDGLVVKQILARDDDSYSPERGQYVFLQALLRTVAYNTLSRRARKERHLAAASYLREAWPGELRDIAEVLASHHLEAIRADPDADDVAELRAAARQTLTAAGQAAASLALGPEADRYFEQAADLAEDALERASLFEQAGRALWQSNDAVRAEERLRRSIGLYAEGGRSTGGRAAVALAEMLRYHGRLEESRELLEPISASEDPSLDPIVRAEALAELAAALAFSGDLGRAGPLIEEALTALELAEAWPALAASMILRGIYLIFSSRRQEGAGVLRQALALAEEHDLPGVALRARNNLAQLSIEADRFSEALEQLEEAHVIARERGDRRWERGLLGNSLVARSVLGRWDEAVAIGASLMAGQADLDAIGSALYLTSIAAARGDDAVGRRCLELAAALRDSTYVDQRLSAAIVLSRSAIERGSHQEAMELLRSFFEAGGASGELIEEAYALSIEAARGLEDEGEMARLEAFVTALPPARTSPLLRAGRARVQAELAHRRRDDSAAARYEDEAIEILRQVGAKPLLARTLMERAGRRDEPDARGEARAICAELGAVRWLARIDEGAGIAA